MDRGEMIWSRWALGLSVVGLLGLSLAPGCAKGAVVEDDSDSVSATQTASGSGGNGGNGGGGASSATGGAGGSGGSGGSLPACEEDPCKLTLPQCGCPSGERCTVKVNLATCEPEGAVDLGDKCGSDCKAGALCYNNLAGGSPTCHKFCASDDDCAGPGALCLYDVGNGLSSLCTQNCDPVSSVGCKLPGELKCDLGREAQGMQRWFTRCTGLGSKVQGETCVSSNQCAAGHGCVGLTDMNNVTTNVCLKWCDVASPSCPNNSQCGTLNPAVVIGSKTYGACVPLSI